MGGSVYTQNVDDDYDPSDEYDNEIKSVGWQIMWHGYKCGRDTESYSPTLLRRAKDEYERFWDMQFAEDHDE